MATPTAAAFSITAADPVIAAPTGTQYIHIVGIMFDNNETAVTNYTKVTIQDGSGGTQLYGGSTSSAFLPGKGGFFDLQMSYDHPYWDLSADTALYITPSSSRRISGTVWYYVDSTAVRAVEHDTFELTASGSIVTAVASETIKVVAMSVHNNDLVDDTVFHLLDGSGGTDLYGGATGAFYLLNNGGVRQLGMSYDTPYFELTTNTALYGVPTSGAQVGGTVWYIQS